jgi:5-methylcytosine-specific restriction endonuclease McrA
MIMKAMASTRVQMLINRLDELKVEFGESAFRRALQMISRRRLENRNREHRRRFSWSKYQFLYQLQKGKCPLCGELMPLLKGEVEIDHKDPNREKDFNNDDNLQLTHRRCNRWKSSLSIYEQAKKARKNMIQCV